MVSRRGLAAQKCFHCLAWIAGQGVLPIIEMVGAQWLVISMWTVIVSDPEAQLEMKTVYATVSIGRTPCITLIIGFGPIIGKYGQQPCTCRGSHHRCDTFIHAHLHHATPDWPLGHRKVWTRPCSQVHLTDLIIEIKNENFHSFKKNYTIIFCRHFIERIGLSLHPVLPFLIDFKQIKSHLSVI